MTDYLNPYQLKVTDADPNTIDTGNEITEDLDTTTIGQDYVNSNDGDYVFLMGIGEPKDFRMTSININSSGLDWTKVSKIIDFLNTLSRAKVVRVYQEVYKHKHAESFDTLPKRLIDTKKALLNFKTFFASSSPNVYKLGIPYVKPDISDADIFAQLNSIKEALGYGVGSNSDGALTRVSMPVKVNYVRV